MYSKWPQCKQIPEITSPECSSAGEHTMPPPSQGPAQRSISGQKIISRARRFGIYFLHRGKKKKKKRWIYPRQEVSCGPVPIRDGSMPRSRKYPQEMGEGAAGLIREPWQESNYFGLSQCYLTLLPGGVNPDTATVQLWKQHQLILLMPSSLQHLLIK